MAWNYSGDPSASDLDEVRFLAQLTDTNNQELSDAEVNYCISVEDNNVAAAARCCEVLASKYAREADIRAGAEGELSIKFSQISQNYSFRAEELRKYAAGYAVPWAGGLKISEKDDQEERSDRVKPSFERGQFSGKGTSETTVKDWNKYGPI